MPAEEIDGENVRIFHHSSAAVNGDGNRHPQRERYRGVAFTGKGDKKPTASKPPLMTCGDMLVGRASAGQNRAASWASLMKRQVDAGRHPRRDLRQYYERTEGALS